MPTETRDLTIAEALDLGADRARRGDHRSAEGLFRGVLVHEPDNFEAIERLGAVLFEQKKIHEALYWFWRGRKINRKHPMALTNYGLCLSQLGHWDEGATDLRMAAHHAERKPTSGAVKALVYNNLGNTLERLGRYDEALVTLDKGIGLKPDDPFPHYNRGIVLLRLNRHEDAIAAFDRAIELDPTNADAYYNRGMGRLALGDLGRGFADYEYRLLITENKVPNLGLPAAKKWAPDQSFADKTILVVAEQGLGDTIQFLRFLPLLRARGTKDILLVVPKAVRPLVADMAGVTVQEPGEIPNDLYDGWIALMSLPLLLDVDSEAKIPAPYAPAIEPERVADWQGQVAFADDRPKIGVCWAGNFIHKNDGHRSIPLGTFAKLFDAPAHFVSLQQVRSGEAEEFADLSRRHRNLTALTLDDFRDTAAVILNLDLVICADTSVAHLAASLGKPTWILVSAFATDWRWQLGRADSPWYPSARLYRQPKIGDWASVIERLRKDLSSYSDA